MKKVRRRSLAEIDRKLSRAVKLLDAAAHDLRDTRLNPRENISKIGSALVAVFEVQHQIYRRAPELAPEWIRDKLAIAGGPSRKTTKVKRVKPKWRRSSRGTSRDA
ncbi:MAG: hypothetical protein JSR66_07305 [Proteobacteria bacterium]|nr:hypothetical protein [Pseudomonadota bacterium]